MYLYIRQIPRDATAHILQTSRTVRIREIPSKVLEKQLSTDHISCPVGLKKKNAYSDVGEKDEKGKTKKNMASVLRANANQTKVLKPCSDLVAVRFSHRLARQKVRNPAPGFLDV